MTHPKAYTQGLAQGGITGAGLNPSRQTEVQSEVERSAKLTSCIEEKMKTLYNECVLRTSPPTVGQNEQKSPKPTLVGHAMALSNHNDQLAQFDYVLGDIIDRLEL